MEQSVPTQSPHRQGEVIEAGKKLSECLLWQLQETFYANAGLEAWNAIPYYPTSNAFIGDSFAELILGFLRDYRAHLDPVEPVHILELATGSGAFSFYLLRALQRKLACFRDLRDLRLRYVMTDFTDSIVQGWRSNAQFQPWIDQGLLDFAVFRPEDQDTLRLDVCGDVLGPGTLRNPVIAIANYFFDSIRQDLFRVSAHALQEGRVTFTLNATAQADTDKTVPGQSSATQVFPESQSEGVTPVSAGNWTLAQLYKTEQFVPAGVDYYPEETFNAVLREYTELFEDASILFPVGALRSLENLRRLSGDKLLVISADKGFTTPDYMKGHKEQFYTPHEGAFSFMVNFDAIARYFRLQGGTAMTDPGNASILDVLVGGVFSGFEGPLENLSYCFNENVVRRDGLNALNLVRRFVHPQRYDSLVLLRSGVAMVQAGDYDPLLFIECAPAILDGIGDEMLVTDYRSLLDAMTGVRANIFAADRRLNVYDALAEIYFKLRCHRECIEVSLQALDCLGERLHSLMHLAAASESLGKPGEALAWYQRASRLDPDSDIIRTAISRLHD